MKSPPPWLTASAASGTSGSANPPASNSDPRLLQQLPYRRLERGQIPLHDDPNCFQIHFKIPMHKDVPQPGDSAPIHFRPPHFAASVRRCVDSHRTCRFRTMASCSVGVAKTTSFPSGVLPDSAKAVEDVLEVSPLGPHNGDASLNTDSRIR